MGPSLDEELNIDKSTLETLKGLYAAKERAVINEDFDEAKKLKVSIDRLKAISGHLGQLEDRKRLAIMNEDYDSAKLIKHEIDKLKESALKPAIADLQFPNIQNNNNNNN
jgi:centrosomal protein CEP104